MGARSEVEVGTLKDSEAGMLPLIVIPVGMLPLKEMPVEIETSICDASGISRLVEVTTKLLSDAGISGAESEADGLAEATGDNSSLVIDGVGDPPDIKEVG